MPSGVIHECINKKLEDYLNIKDDNRFYVGAVAPDSWRNSPSTKEGTHFYVDGVDSARYDLFFEKYKEHMDNPFVLGYFIHLISDEYWYSNIYEDLVKDDKYWMETHKLLYKLSNHYGIKTIEQIDNSFDNPIEELDNTGINHTIDFINEVAFRQSRESLEMFNIDEQIENINKTVEFVKSELDKYGIKNK